MAGAEILGDDRRHRAKTASEAQQHDGVGGSHSEETVNSVHQPEHHDLNPEYQRERADGPDAVGYGAQKKRPSALNSATPPYVAATNAGARLVNSCIMAPHCR